MKFNLYGKKPTIWTYIWRTLAIIWLGYVIITGIIGAFQDII